MKSLTLRHANRLAAQLQYAANQWQQQGQYDVAYLRLNTHGRYISFQAIGQQGMWSGLVEAKEWLARFAPEIAALATSNYDEQTVLELFSATPKPFALDKLNLPYTHLQIGDMVTGGELADHPLICVNTERGAIWIQTLPTALTWDHTGSHEPLNNLPVPLCFVLGYSTLSFPLLSKLAQGDVLLISKKTFSMTTNGKILGTYQLTEGGIQVENFYGEDYSSESNDDHHPSSSEELPMSDQHEPMAFGHLPVKLEFVLDERSVNIADLAQLAPGSLLELKPDAEQSIAIRVNGALLAKGELVQLEDRLGVEIKTIYSNPK